MIPTLEPIVLEERSGILARFAGSILRHARLVVALWIIVLLVSALFAVGLNSRLENGGYTPPGSPSDVAAQIGQRYFGKLALPSGYIALIAKVGATPEDITSDASRAADSIKRTRGVESVGSAILSADHQAALIPVSIEGDLGKGQTYVPGIADALQEADLSSSKAYLVGETPMTYRMAVQSRKSLQLATIVSLPATLIILLIAFLSLSAAILPLGLASMSVGVTFGMLYVLSFFTQLSVFVEDTVLVLGLGLSIDFSLFMVTRVREELAKRPDDVAGAITEVIATTGRAITISAMTITAALSGLYLVDVGLFSSLATGAIGATIVAFAAALTLVPSILILFGHRIEKFPIRVAVNASESGRFWQKLADFVVKRRVPVVVVTFVIMLAMATPLLGIKLGYPTISVLPSSDPIVQANDLVVEHFGPDAGSPAIILAQTSPAKLVSAVTSTEGVLGVTSPQRGGDGWVQLDATLKYAPDSDAASATISRLRESLRASIGPSAIVAGSTALGVDLIARINQRTLPVVLWVLLVDIVILTLVFRAPLIAIKAALTTLLSVVAALGIMNLIFSGRDDGITYFVPLFLFTIVFGLSTDYEVFLISRIREYYRSGVGNTESVKLGLVRSARSITLAGIAMAIVFFSFAASPLTPFKELGVAMGLSIIVDVTLVRGLLVPATIVMLGKWNWWQPGRKLSSAAH